MYQAISLISFSIIVDVYENFFSHSFDSAPFMSVSQKSK